MADHAASRSSFAIVSSPAAYARLDAVQSFIEGLPPSLELLLVGHTREAVDDVARDVTRSRGASFGVHRFSMRQLASRLAAIELARHGQAVASPLGAEAVAARAAFDALDTGALDYLTPIARLRSIGQTLRSTLDDLRAADVDVGELSAHGARGDDVRVLAEGFGAQLSDAGLVDRSALFRAAAAALDAVVWVPVTGPLVLVDVEIHDAAVLALVRALCSRASHILVTAPTGDDQTLDALARLPGAPTPTRVGALRAPGGDALDSVREYLFDPTTLPEPASPAPTDLPSVKLFSAPGEGRECVEIARAALAEAERGVSLDRMAILVRAPQLYGGLLETALDRAGLPGWFVRGTRVPDPSGRAYLALLACAAEQLSARRFAEYLSLAQVPMLSDEGGPPQESPKWVPPDSASTELPAQALPAQLSLFDLSAPEAEPAGDHETVLAQPVVAGSLRAPRQWDRLLVESAVIGGRSRWTRRLDGLAEELRLRRAEHASDDPESPRVRALERDLENLSHLRRFALPVIDALAAFPSRATWGLWLDQLEQLTPMVLKDPERVQSVLGELRPMARVGPVALAEVRDVLAGRLTSLHADPPSRRFGQIFVGLPEHARGRQFDVVFVPGLAERIFPQKQRQDPLLLDDVRRALNESQSSEGVLGLPTQDERAANERLLLKLAAGAATTRLYLSYPRLQLSESRPRVPSFYALDVERARRGKVPDFPTLEQEAYEQAKARLAWPAPDDPRDAIDDTEHDLAILGPLLRPGVTADVKGRARYLLSLNPGLRRSLLTRWARWTTPWSRYDGLCDPNAAAREALAAHRLHARPYSVSALQRFARCPYQFFLSAVLRLEPREEAEPLERMDPLTRGRMFHEVQAEFVRELRRRGELPITSAAVDAAERSLDATLDRIAAAYHDELAPAIERVWSDEVEWMRADLKGWVHRVVDEDGEWVPIHSEFGFGFGGGDGRDPASVPDPVTLEGQWQLHGVVDAVEARTGPSVDGELRVTDHKTGRNRTRARMVVGHGEVLQPVLYGLAVEEALGRPVHASRLFFCTVAGGFASRSVPLGPDERRQGLEVLEIVDRALEAGELLPAPRAGACAWCDFLEVCGPWEEKRVDWKDQARLADLHTLRRMP